MKRLAFLVVLLGGCAAKTDLVLLRTLPGPARGPEGITMLMGDQPPPCPFEEVGEITGYASATDAKVLAAMKTRVAAANADGIVGLHKGGMGTVGQGNWQGRVYVCKPATAAGAP